MTKPFEFTAKDFEVEGGPTGYALSVMADRANAKLREWLRDAPIVYGRHDGDCWGNARYEADTLKAKLVCIEEIK